ncbi:protein app1-like [Brassica napus]|uniref:protein app1-like n=1 Tax=Brassica napus TaxID=3708 RepID=UPI000BBE337C|nr:protein app1-like [Brassica napus]
MAPRDSGGSVSDSSTTTTPYIAPEDISGYSSSASTSVPKAQSQTAPPPHPIAPGDISGYSSSASTSVPETQSQTSPPPPPLIAPAAPLVPPAVPHIASGLHPDLMVPSKAPYAQ